jgi:hypothetical protein
MPATYIYIGAGPTLTYMRCSKCVPSANCGYKKKPSYISHHTLSEHPCLHINRITLHWVYHYPAYILPCNPNLLCNVHTWCCSVKKNQKVWVGELFTLLYEFRAATWEHDPSLQGPGQGQGPLVKKSNLQGVSNYCSVVQYSKKPVATGPFTLLN